MTASFSLSVQGSPKEGMNVKLLKPVAFTDNTITSAEELAYLAQQVNSKATDYKGITIKLGNDIDIAGYYWTPIGYYNSFSVYASFQRVFDGQNNKILNLKISTNGTKVGLFGTCGNGLFLEFVRYLVYDEFGSHKFL